MQRGLRATGTFLEGLDFGAKLLLSFLVLMALYLIAAVVFGIHALVT
jgi:hypothetical protein